MSGEPCRTKERHSADPVIRSASVCSRLILYSPRRYGSTRYLELRWTRISGRCARCNRVEIDVRRAWRFIPRAARAWGYFPLLPDCGQGETGFIRDWDGAFVQHVTMRGMGVAPMNGGTEAGTVAAAGIPESREEDDRLVGPQRAAGVREGGPRCGPTGPSPRSSAHMGPASGRSPGEGNRGELPAAGTRHSSKRAQTPITASWSVGRELRGRA